MSEPVNCFLLFCKEERQTISQHCQAWDNSQVTSHLGELWREMDSKLKLQYKKRAATAKKVSSPSPLVISTNCAFRHLLQKTLISNGSPRQNLHTYLPFGCPHHTRQSQNLYNPKKESGISHSTLTFQLTSTTLQSVIHQQLLDPIVDLQLHFLLIHCTIILMTFRLSKIFSLLWLVLPTLRINKVTCMYSFKSR